VGSCPLPLPLRSKVDTSTSSASTHRLAARSPTSHRSLHVYWRGRSSSAGGWSWVAVSPARRRCDVVLRRCARGWILGSVFSDVA
jgi:5-methylcytosine-specific restriction endonuclease McrA